MAAIRTVLQTQTEAWNRGDLDAFMIGYWESDSLKFIGKNGMKQGWETTLANYRKNYPDKAAMGKLSFQIISIEKLGSQHAFVVGKWMLEREKDTPQGHFTLLWKKINGKWVIIADHSS